MLTIHSQGWIFFYYGMKNNIVTLGVPEMKFAESGPLFSFNSCQNTGVSHRHPVRLKNNPANWQTVYLHLCQIMHF